MEIKKALRMKKMQGENLCHQTQTPIYAGSRLPGNSRSAPEYVNTGLTDPRMQQI